MIKTLPPSKFPLANAKCGEIYCKSSTSFSILCSFCTTITRDYYDFIKHIKITHLKSKSNSFEEYADSEAAPFVKLKIKPKVLNACNPLDDELPIGSHELMKDACISETEESDSSLNYDATVMMSSCDKFLPTANITDFSSSTQLHVNAPVYALEEDPTESNQEDIDTIIEKALKDSEESPTEINENMHNFTDIEETVNDRNENVFIFTKEDEVSADTQHDVPGIAETYAPKLKKKPLKRERIIACSKCSAKFVSRSKFQQHSKYVHDQEELPEPLQCPQCKRKYTRSKTFYHHLLDEHGEISCDKCDKKFDQLNKFKIHYPQHNVERNFVCDFKNCNKRFTCHNNLYYHKISHRPVKPYVCEQCGYSAHRLVTLRIHMRIHTGEKPYTCPVCQESFRSTSILASHRRKHSDIRSHVCDICSTKYKSRKSLLTHQEVHLNINLKCKICGQAFKRSSTLKAHVKRHEELS